MARILFFVALAFVFWLVVRMLGRSRQRRDEADAAVDASSEPPGIEAILQCAWCGVHVPRGEALTLSDGRVYCSAAHRDAAVRIVEPAGSDRP